MFNLDIRVVRHSGVVKEFDYAGFPVKIVKNLFGFSLAQNYQGIIYIDEIFYELLKEKGWLDNVLKHEATELSLKKTYGTLLAHAVALSEEDIFKRIKIKQLMAKAHKQRLLERVI
jgi:hypothetical protein